MKNKTSFIKKSSLFICVGVLAAAILGWQLVEPAPQTVTRAAVDVGSGGLKVTVAKVDPQSRKIHKILSSKEYAVPLKRDMQANGQSAFSEKIQQVAIETLANVKNDLATHKPHEWSGIATAASRQAKNAPDLYEKIADDLAVKIEIISQNEEGRLGFATASAVSGVPSDQLVSFDSGSGSFQLTTLIDGELEVAEGQLGHIPSLEALMEIRGETLDLETTPPPVTLDEAQMLVEMLSASMPDLSPSFEEKLTSPDTRVVGIGSENFIFAMGARGVGKNTFTKSELWAAIESHAGLSPETMKAKGFTQPNTAVLGMVLLYTIMDGLNIDQITSHYANGSCEGLLVDPSYWTIEKV